MSQIKFKTLREDLESLRKENRASFHMPGHKYGGSGLQQTFKSFWDIDVTEIPGADNLHDPEDILLQAKQRAQEAYGSRESFFLVNGSSCGIMAMIMGCVKRGGSIVISRDAHRSVHQAVSLGGLRPIYLMPEIDAETGIAIGISASRLEEALAEHSDIEAVVCTYPSYSGACIDIKAIRRITREKNVLLLVDEAHGAHLWLDESLPESSLDMGADVVVQSLHKTMPAMTQTAILHLGTADAPRDKIAHYLTIFQSSSPSYVLLASIDEAIAIGTQVGREAMVYLLDRLIQVEDTGIKEGFVFWNARYFNEKGYRFDPTKLCISGHLLGVDGYRLDELLRLHGVQSEYAVKSHVLLMASISNTEEDFLKLEHAMVDISRELKASGQTALTFESVQDDFTSLSSEMILLPGEAEIAKSMGCPLDQAEGKIAADWLIPYPPGVPILCPGERIDWKHLEIISSYARKGHKVLGLKDHLIQIVIE